MTKDQVTAKVGDKEITIGSGNITKQADGTVTVQMGETIVMTAVVAATKSREGQDWFPLQVDYRERAHAAGQIPGNYFRREGRPSDKEILTCRLTDRPIRPLSRRAGSTSVRCMDCCLVLMAKMSRMCSAYLVPPPH